MALRLSVVLLCLLMGVGIFYRLDAIFLPLYDDAAAMAIATEHSDILGVNLLLTPHPVLTGVFYTFAAKIFGYSGEIVRIVPLLFNLAVIIYALFIVNRMYGNSDLNRLVAMFFLLTFFSFLMGITPDSDSSVLVLTSLGLLHILICLSAGKLKERSGVILFGIIFLIGLLTKLRFLLFVPVLFIWIFFYSRNFKRTFLITTTVVFIGLFGLSGWILLNYLNFGEIIIPVARDVFFHSSPTFNFVEKLSLGLYLNTLVAFTPLFGLVIFYLFAGKNFIHKYDRYLVSWLVILSLELLILLPADVASDYPRYLSLVFIPLMVLTSRVIMARFKLSEAIYAVFAGTSLGFVLFIINKHMKSFWYFLSATGPVIGVNQQILGLLLLTSLLLFCLVLFCRIFRSPAIKVSMILFIVISMAFNALLVYSSIFSSEHRMAVEFFDEYARKNNLSLPIYSWNEDIPYYLHIANASAPNINLFKPSLQPYAHMVGFNENGFYDLDSNVSHMENIIKSRGGTVMLLNYPYKYVVEKNPAHQEVFLMISRNCNLRKEILYKLQPIGQVFMCPKPEFS